MALAELLIPERILQAWFSELVQMIHQKDPTQHKGSVQESLVKHDLIKSCIPHLELRKLRFRFG